MHVTHERRGQQQSVAEWQSCKCQVASGRCGTHSKQKCKHCNFKRRLVSLIACDLHFNLNKLYLGHKPQRLYKGACAGNCKKLSLNLQALVMLTIRAYM